MTWGRWDSRASLHAFKGLACYRLDVRLGPLVLSCAWWRKSWRERH